MKANSDGVVRLANLKRWDGSNLDEFEDIDDDDWAKMKARGDPQVVVESTRKSQGVKRPYGALTPTSSPQTKCSKPIALKAKKTQSTLKRQTKKGRQQPKEAAPKSASGQERQARRYLPRKLQRQRRCQKANTVFKFKKPNLRMEQAQLKGEYGFPIHHQQEGKPSGPTLPPSSENESEGSKPARSSALPKCRPGHNRQSYVPTPRIVMSNRELRAGVASCF